MRPNEPVTQVQNRFEKRTCERGANQFSIQSHTGSKQVKKNDCRTGLVGRLTRIGLGLMRKKCLETESDSDKTP